MTPIYTYVRGDLTLGAPVHAGMAGSDGYYFTMHTNTRSIIDFCKVQSDKRSGHPRPTVHPIMVYADGNAWCAVPIDFVNLQESPAGFGDTMVDAIEQLCEAMHTKTEPK